GLRVFLRDQFHLPCRFLAAEFDDFIDVQAPGDLVGDEEHRHLAFQLVDGFGEMFGGVLVEVGGGLLVLARN
ncbi:MAG: hypothetical protein LBF16_10735, partial [Pseudomonadales bacterium]|nr:hypothetical protein [Pseudomonadales bacterium]